MSDPMKELQEELDNLYMRRYSRISTMATRVGRKLKNSADNLRADRYFLEIDLLQMRER